jgi:alcohol dehydrogenase class IV
VGIFLIPTLQFQLNDPEQTQIQETLAYFAKSAGIATWADSAKVACEQVIIDIQQLQSQLGFPKTLQECGITATALKEQMSKIISRIMISNGVPVSPRLATEEIFEKIIWYTFEGKKIDF